MAQVQSGDLVQVHYTGQLENGTVFGSSRDGDPVQFRAGGKEMLPGISQAVLGMEEGEAKSITVPPEQGFGPRQEQLQQNVPRSALPEEAKVGDQLQAQTGDGQKIPVWVRDINDQTAVVDGNHPLAGQTLTFEIQLLAIVSPSEEGS